MTESAQEKARPNGPAPSPFTQLIIMLATTSLQQLGMMPDPEGGRPEVHLESAQGMIDLIEMLEVKTKGNLETEEKKMLAETLTMLRFHYVEVAQALSKGPAPSAAPKEPPSTPPQETAESPIIESAGGAKKDDDSKTKYRKSYG